MLKSSVSVNYNIFSIVQYAISDVLYNINIR